MREILFRAKKIVCGARTDEWEYGVPLMSNPNSEIAYIKQVSSYEYQVDPKTIGQYTGLKDKNGTKIFEGDIVVINTPDNCGNMNGFIGIVAFNDCAFELEFIEDRDVYESINLYNEEDLEVIGNVFDNGDLTIEN